MKKLMFLLFLFLIGCNFHERSAVLDCTCGDQHFILKGEAHSSLSFPNLGSLDNCYLKDAIRFHVRTPCICQAYRDEEKRFIP